MLRLLSFILALTVSAAHAKEVVVKLEPCRTSTAVGCQYGPHSIVRITNSDLREIKIELKLFASDGLVLKSWRETVPVGGSFQKSMLDELSDDDHRRLAEAHVAFDGKGFVQHVFWSSSGGPSDFPVPAALPALALRDN